MSIDSTTTEPIKEETTLHKVADLGSSPLGESVALRRIPPQSPDSADADKDDSPHFVMKKITKALLKSPETFRQNFEALRRLDHPNLCPYRDLYIGERTIRITRDFIPGLPIDEFLLQPITEAESQELQKHTQSLDESSPELSAHPPELDEHEEPPTETAPPPKPAQDMEEEDPKKSSHEETSGPSSDNDDPLDRPATLEIPTSLLEDSDAADRALDLIILRLRRLLPGIISALEYLHRFRRVHASLKPTNILVTPDEQVILTDYDLCPALQLSSPTPRPLDFRAPETYQGQFSPSADLYSLGAILFYALAGRPYGELRHAPEEDAPHEQTRPLYLTEILPHCPASWSDLIHGLLASDPEQRLTIDEVHRQIASSEHRSVNIRATIVQERHNLFGRQDSLAALTEHATACSQNRRLAMALIQGRTGVGKTALVDALARWASQRGWIVLQGRSFHREPIAYQAWEEIAARLATVADELPEKLQRRLSQPRSRAARIFPQLAIPQDSPPPVDAPAARAGLRTFIEGVSQQRPMLICLDDLHWAGEDSIQLLADLAAEPERLRVMFVATANQDDQTAQLSFLKRELSTAPVEPLICTLQPFTKTEAREYVLGHAAHLTLPQKQQILRQGGFNPLLIDELIHELNQNLLDPESPHELSPSSPAQSSQDEPQDEDTLEQRLCALIEQRLAGLSRSERLALQLLAVASGPLSTELLEQALSQKVGTQTADLLCGEEIAQTLIERRLVREARQLTQAQQKSPQFTVIHEKCRQVIQKEIGQDHLGRLCGIIADALTDKEDLARDLRFEYLRRAGRDDEAAQAAKIAAQSALQRFAFHRAAQLLTWLADHGPLPAEQQKNLASALFNTGDFTAAQQTLNDLLKEASPADSPALRRLLLQTFLATGERLQAITSLDDSLRALDSIYLHRSAIIRAGARQKRWASALGRAADITTIATDQQPPALVRAQATLLKFGIHTGPLLHSPSSSHLIHRFGNLAHKHRFGPHLAMDRLHTTGAPWIPFLLRPSKSLERRLQQAQTLFERHSDLPGQAATTELQAYLSRHMGDLPRAKQLAQQALETLDQGGRADDFLQTRLICFQVDADLATGQPQRAKQRLDSLRHLTRRRQDLQSLIDLLVCDLALLTGDLLTAEARINNIRTFIGKDRNCLLHLAMMERYTKLNIALGRPEVAIAQWDLLLDQIYERSLRQMLPAKLIIYRSLAIALITQLQRKLAIQEARRHPLWRRLARSLRRLADLEPWMGAEERALMQRLRTRVELLRQRPNKALKHARRARQEESEHAPAIIRIMNKEALGTVLERLENPEGRAQLDHSRKFYDDQGLFLPLVLEGWPAPTAHSMLKKDP